MKKIVLLALLALIPVFASAVGIRSVRLSSESLYEENPVDPYGFDSDIHAMFLPIESERDIEFLVYHDDGTGSTVCSTPVDRFDDGAPKKAMYLKGRFDICRSLAVTTIDFDGNFPDLVLDINLNAGLDACFEATGGSDILSYDGLFFFGPEAKVGDFLALRTGLMHMSGHYGDEVLQEFEKNNGIDKSGDLSTIMIDGERYYYYGLAQYVRDNCFIFGVQGTLPFGLKLYAEYSAPFWSSFVRPFFECPSSHSTSTMGANDFSAWVDLAEGEGIGPISVNESYREQFRRLIAKLDPSYKAARVHFGAMWSMMVGQFGFSSEFDLQFHQDGQTLHTFDGYSPDNPWEYELSIGFGVEVYDLDYDNSFGIEFQYHDGRFPSLNLFNNRARYFCVGLRIR